MLPKVKVRRLSAKATPSKNFEMPKAYVKYRVRLNEEMDSILEYDVDEEVSSDFYAFFFPKKCIMRPSLYSAFFASPNFFLFLQADISLVSSLY